MTHPAYIAIALIMLAGCDGWPDTIPPEYQCHQGLTVSGIDHTDALDTTVDRACYEASRAIDARQAPTPTIYLRVYGSGERPHFCTNVRSGTCWRKVGEAYEIEVRKPRFREPVSVRERIRHEVSHCILNAMGERSTHGRMRELGLCGPRTCGDPTDWTPRALQE